MKNWETIQRRYADIEGERGAKLRLKHYAPFFLRMGQNVHIEHGCRFYHPIRIVLDDDARLNIGVLIYGSGGVWIGRHVRIGPRCFIHSANHDVSYTEKAFFERGYVEDAVVVGDLSLISANVSILPGAQLDPGCFVACGAVVPKGHYQEGSRLRGVPARKVDQEVFTPIEPKPDIVILVPDQGVWKDLATHILGTLGLPQVQIIRESEIIPSSAHSVLVFGPTRWSPGIEIGILIWQISEGDTEAKHADLPKYKSLRVVPTNEIESKQSIEYQFEQAAFWVITRLRKGSGALGLREFCEWLAALRILKLSYGRKDQLLENILSSLLLRSPKKLRKISKPPSIEEDLDGWLTDLLCKAERLTAVNKLKRYFNSPSSLSFKEAFSDPSLMLRKIENGLCTESEFSIFLNKMLSTSTTGLRLVSFGVGAILLRDDKSFDLLDNLISTSEWHIPGISVPRTIKNGSGLCYSPLVLAWLVLKAKKENLDFEVPDGIGKGNDCGQSLDWMHFSQQGLIDKMQKKVSRSLVDNWVIFHSASCLRGTQFQIDRNCYSMDTYKLEQLWLSIFREMQSNAGRNLLRLRPWPSGYKAAVSLRYDVDRPISANTISKTIGLQARYTNAACASWYYFPDHRDKARQEPQLKRHWQEIGLHIESVKDAEEGAGVTHHSSPKAEYWRGDDTNRIMNKVGVSYCEFLAARLTTPRPAWVVDGQNGSIGKTWTTPLHFPLEGSTNDKDLSYFDGLLDEFHSVFSNGGHAIIGSHPDLDQSNMKKLLKREDLSEVWFATVSNVIARCRKVMTPGNVIAFSREDSIVLFSNKHIADLAIEIWQPGAALPQIKDTQLIGSLPREVLANLLDNSTKNRQI